MSNQLPCNLLDDTIPPSTAQAPVDSSSDTAEKLLRDQLKSMQNSIQEVLVSLLCDHENGVRRALVTVENLKKLCEFFGKEKAREIILSHMITFLNDKTDWRLRAAFFECCHVVAAFIGWQSTLILKPLLQQGLRDFEEFVVFRALSCLANLCQNGLLHKHVIYELLPHAVPFLSHPNEWLCIAVVSFLSALEKSLNLADMHCKVMPVVNPYLKQPLIKLDQKSILLRCLKEPLPRSIWDLVIRSRSMSDLLDFLNDKAVMRNLGGGPHSLFSTTITALTPSDASVVSKFHSKLVNQGLTEEGEERLLAFSDILLKMKKLMASMSDDHSPSYDNRPGLIDLKKLPIVRKHADLTVKLKRRRQESVRRKKKEIDDVMNQEWRTMFCGSPQVIPNNNSIQMPEQARSVLSVEDWLETPVISNVSEKDGDCTSTDDLMEESSSTESISQSITTAAMEQQIVISTCRRSLTELVEHKRDEWALVARFDETLERPQKQKLQKMEINDKIEGKVVAQLHEHKSAVNRISSHPEGRLFLSCSSDGTVKLWDGKRLEGHGIANRSEYTYSGIGDKVRSVCFIDGGERLCCVGDNCAVHLVDASTMQLVAGFRTKCDKEGPIMDVLTWNDGLRSYVFGLSHHGHLLCFDTRSRSGMPVWSGQVPTNRGLATSFCIDPDKQHWSCVGTTSGQLSVWDLRFHLEVNNCLHPSASEAVKFVGVWPASSGSSSTAATVWAAADGNGELSLWDLETSTQLSAIWPSETPPLSYAQKCKLVSTALTKVPDSNRLFVGDSNGAIRCWNLTDPKDCFYMSGPEEKTGAGRVANGTKPKQNHFFKSFSVNGIPVLTATTNHSKDNSSIPSINLSGGSLLDLKITTWHSDAISDLSICDIENQRLLISSGRDGVIKIWR